MQRPSFEESFRGRRVLVTGNTGFKGSWLCLWLSRLGARVCGIALAPEGQPNHWELLQLGMVEQRLDITDAGPLQEAMAASQPEIVFHLAAQALVRRSYADPLATWNANVLGTANVLEACRRTAGVRAVVCVTSDKCYRNEEWAWGYRETDHLGGHDPYSASKAAAELVASSYRDAFFQGEGGPLVATARAGNVIGGGDWSQDRLVPDLARAMACGETLDVRFPQATRPWQHVLESLCGYLLLAQRLLAGEKAAAEAWNFGPDMGGNRTVAELLAQMQTVWPGIRWQCSKEQHPHETTLLYIDSAQARRRLGWQPVWGGEEAVRMTAAWYRDFLESGSCSSAAQLEAYVLAARRLGMGWAGA